jgi:hypothetical protein
MATLEKLRKEIEQLKARKATPPSTPVVTKDLAAANLVETWKGEGAGLTVNEFFQQVEDAAVMGRWTDDDKIE